MPLIKSDEMLQHAYRNGFAVGAFDVLSLEVLQGILEAAEGTRSTGGAQCASVSVA